MIRSLFNFSVFSMITIFSLSLYALEGIQELSKKLFEKNQEIVSLEKSIESKQALISASKSAFYPTLNAVVGYGQNKTDDMANAEKGQIGFIEGKLNLFRGLKDQSINDQRNIEVEIAKLDLNLKKRELQLEMTEIASQMVLLHKLQTVLDEELKTTQTQKQMALKKISAGLTSAVDKLEFELRENEIQIEQRQINQKHDEAHQHFFKIYGEEITDTEINRIDFSPVMEKEKFIQKMKELKFENTLEYQKAKLNEEHLILEKKEIKSDYLPSLDFSYSAGRLTPTETTPIKYNENKYSLQLTIPLFSGFDTYYKTKAASLSLLASERIRNQTKTSVESEFRILKDKFIELTDLIQIYDKKLASSQSYFDMTLAEYRRGVKNSPDLVGATERLFSTRKKKFETLKELEVLKVKMESYLQFEGL